MRARLWLAFITAGHVTESRERLFSTLVALSVFFYLCSLVFVAGGFLPDEYSWMASAILFLNGLVMFASELRARTVAANVGYLLAVMAAGFALEYAGVTTGVPFGTYSYTDALAFRVLGVPVAIAVAWYTTVMASWRISQWIHGGSSSLRIALSAGILTLALDIALEPMASTVARYWLWKDGIIPPQNYVSWFVFGTTVVWLVAFAERKRNREPLGPLAATAGLVFGMQFTLFLATNARHGLFIPAAVACLFLAIPFVSRIKHRRLYHAERMDD